MKNKIIVLLCCVLVFSIAGAAQSATKTDTIKVYGNCETCKSKIEGSLKKKDGVISKDWNTETKMLIVTYDPSKITIKQIGEKIAAVGYDNQYATAPDATYNGLPKCCQYERPKKN
ncbi:MAG: heavy-metal-associated domain-containing protein [Bacteroidetes bacterium]|nr:heavy-metal-associated domain-containing protein [Bacteroidota bacterium]